MRVLHLITRFLKGGAEKTTKNTLYSLQDATDQYDLRLGFGAEYDPDEVASVQNESIETVCFRSIRQYNPVTHPIAVFAVARYLRREEIDILHTHSTEAGIIGRLAGWLAGTPVVIHEVHGDPITKDRNPALNATIGRLERVTARLSTRIIVKSEIIRKTYLERGFGWPEQYELIYHGVDLERFRDVEPAAIGGSDSEVVLLFVGRLEDGKGLFDLLSAFEDLELPGGQSARLLIAGDGSERSSVIRRGPIHS